jgi:hypothetical protein
MNASLAMKRLDSKGERAVFRFQAGSKGRHAIGLIATGCLPDWKFRDPLTMSADWSRLQ